MHQFKEAVSLIKKLQLQVISAEHSRNIIQSNTYRYFFNKCKKIAREADELMDRLCDSQITLEIFVEVYEYSFKRFLILTPFFC